MKIEYKMQINNFFKRVKIGQIGTEHQFDHSITDKDNNKTYQQKHKRTKTKLKSCRWLGFFTLTFCKVKYPKYKNQNCNFFLLNSLENK